MKKKILRIILISGVVALSNIITLYAAEAPPALRRFAFLIGADNGGTERVELAYAGTDARSMADVLFEMGGVEKADTIVLNNPETREVLNAFKTMKSLLADSADQTRRTEFIFYYSGHSDEHGLLLKGEILPYKELKDNIQDIDADVHIAILDSCASGAFTRLKGGQRQSPFMLDESVDTRGHAFLTSSSEDEAAQESDSIEASFFTYYLVAALRGAADVTMDGKVTLNEAYSYAAEETLARTEQTLAGAQHASYDFQLAGSGDLVLTDLRTASARLEVESSIAGRLYIRDLRGRLIAELRKLHGVPLSFGLPSGAYRISLEGNDGLKETNLIISEGKKAVLYANDFREVRPEITRIRGDEEKDKEDELIHIFNSISFIPNFASYIKYNIVHNVSIGLIGLAYRIEGFEAGLLNFVTEDVRGAQAGAIFNITGGDLSGGQAAAVFNINGGDASFFQGAGVFNINGGGFSGFQGAGVFNITGGTLNGFQGSGVFNIAGGDVSGAQGAGVFSIAEGDLRGAQGSGVFNIAEGSFRGFQGAGVFNISEGSASSGCQIAGVFNAAEDLKGGQVSLVNIAEDLRGAQVGLVNIGEDIRGTQIGLININEDIHGIPIGLINISEKGLYHLQGWYDEFGYTYGAVQAGTRNIYTIGYAGVPYNDPSGALAAGLGMGLNFRLGNLYIEGDVAAKRIAFGSSFEESVQDIFLRASASNIFPAARCILGFRVFDFLSVFGGFSVNGSIRGITDSSLFVFEGNPWQTITTDDGSLAVDLYPCWTFGIRI